MNKETVRQWLANPHRTMVDGVNIYNIFKLDEKKDEFFNNNLQAPTNSMPMKILYRQIDRIYNKFNDDEARMMDIYEERKDRVKALQDGYAPAPEGKKIHIKGVIPKPIPKEQQPIQMRPIGKRQRFNEDPTIQVNELPKELQQLYFDNKQLIAQASNLHNDMSHEGDKHKRKTLLEQIDEMEKKRTENWSRINAFIDTGKMEQAEQEPDKAEAIKANMQEVEKYRVAGIKNGNLRRALREYDNLDKKKKVKRAESIVKWYNDLVELEKAVTDPMSKGIVQRNIEFAQVELKKKGIV